MSSPQRPDDPSPQAVLDPDLKQAVETLTQTPITRRRLIAGAAVAGVGIAASSLIQDEAPAATPQEAAPQSPAGVDTVKVSLTVNRKQLDLDLEPRVTLLDALREYAGLTGTKVGCDHGQCGACTVLVDGRRIDSCLTLAIMNQGKQITTIEGLAKGDELHPVQAAFIQHDGFQCGYCTPGQICSAVGLINEGHCKTDDDIREQMSGNICRCGAYPNIVAAVRQAMEHSA